MVTCGKTAFVAPTGKLKAEVDYLSEEYPWIKIYQSKDNLESALYGIAIKNPGISNVPRNAKSLFESGNARLRKEYDRKTSRWEHAGGILQPSLNMQRMDVCPLCLSFVGVWEQSQFSCFMGNGGVILNKKFYYV